VALADLADPGRDLRVPAGREVGEQVVLDLVAQVAGEEVEDATPGQVRRAEDLTQVPMAA
jgi:hypothetical protein